MKSIMLDLETMGTKPYSAIIAIGAVVFDTIVRTIEKEFYTPIRLTSCQDYGLTSDASTIEWWLKQSEAARSALFNCPTGLSTALDEFAAIFVLYPELEVWGNGADFDNVLLSCAYERYGRELPWRWSKNRCYRTMKNLYPNVKIARVGTHHNALDDAKSQALHLIDIMNPNREWVTLDHDKVENYKPVTMRRTGTPQIPRWEMWPYS